MGFHVANLRRGFFIGQYSEMHGSPVKKLHQCEKKKTLIANT